MPAQIIYNTEALLCSEKVPLRFGHGRPNFRQISHGQKFLTMEQALYVEYRQCNTSRSIQHLHMHYRFMQGLSSLLESHKQHSCTRKADCLRAKYSFICAHVSRFQTYFAAYALTTPHLCALSRNRVQGRAREIKRLLASVPVGTKASSDFSSSSLVVQQFVTLSRNSSCATPVDWSVAMCAVTEAVTP